MNDRVDILILTASFGNGHNSATQAILEEIRGFDPNIRVDSVDVYGIAMPRLKDYVTGTYDVLTRSQPGLYNRLYDIRSKSPKNVVDNLMVQMTFDRFLDYVRPRNPRIIISVFPTGAAFASYFKREYQPDVKLITCITDVVDSWEWIYPNTDAYFVPSASVGERLRGKDVPKERIVVTGVPVRMTFRQEKPEDHEPNELKQLLILANAMGSVGINRKVLSRLGSIPDMKIVIITGGQKHLYERLTSMNIHKNIEIVGYTDRIADYMAQSDLIISKAGGATIFEAIEMELPMLIQSSKVGQESYNLEFIREAGIGELVDGREDLFERISEMLHNKRHIQTYRRNIRNFKKTLNPDRIAPTIYSMLSSERRTDFRVS